MEETNTPQEATSSVTASQNYAIPFAIVIAGLAIAGAIYFGDGKQAAVAAQPAGTVDPVTSSDHILGNPNAKVVIVEYSDPECPFCKSFHATMNRIMSEYGKDGKVAWVYRHWIARPQHTKAPKEAAATECASKLGGNTKFWEYINKLFDTTQGNNTLDLNELPKIAAGIGINVDAFNKCLESADIKTLVEKKLEDGQRNGRGGTPYSIIFVGEKLVGSIEGAYPYEAVKAQIEELLK